ncbi:hypothetical protein [Streptacidiphilus melanogenes]|uniref:hypothetical protein n=1 Tax=Streptacidiphilus melanogenes TaxID=411235 RepID=UPI00126A711F|nr:hypothetical protein [Streptacidiphilus melanogenes]
MSTPADSGSQSAAELTAEPTAEPAPELAPAPEAASVPRPRGRTARIMAAAVAVGVLGGAGTGYAVQASRKPTPLPPLAVAQPQYPSAHRSAPALTAAEDDMAKTDGDLTKLLVPVPSGSKPWPAPLGENGWLPFKDFIEGFEKPDSAMRYQLPLGIRRIAVATWLQGSDSYEIQLVQYRHDQGESATSFINGQAEYASDDVGGLNNYTQIPDSSITGGVYVGPKQHQDPDGGSYYEGVGLAVHGDIAVLIYVDSSHRVDGKPLMNLLQSQLERL